jgi:UDP-N-acetylglucosamine acyltransferase
VHRPRRSGVTQAVAARIHPTAIIDSRASLAGDVEVGPYSIVGPDVEIGAGTRIGPHVVIGAHTRIGARNAIFQFASVGEVPQDKKYKGEPTRLEIGDDNTIREFCTLNRGTAQDVGVTRVGNNNWIMAYVHIAHDCQVGNHAIFANSTQLAGHVHIGDYAILGGFTGVHQFCRVGAHSMTSISAVLRQDLPPFVLASGNSATPHGINAEGLRRRGFGVQAIAAIKRAYKTLYKSGLSFDEARARIATEAGTQPELQVLADFLAVAGRGVIR